MQKTKSLIWLDERIVHKPPITSGEKDTLIRFLIDAKKELGEEPEFRYREIDGLLYSLGVATGRYAEMQVYGKARFEKQFESVHGQSTATPAASQSVAVPAVDKGDGSSWQITVIGAVLLLIVGGIGWTVINTFDGKNVEKNDRAAVVEVPANEIQPQQNNEPEKFVEPNPFIDKPFVEEANPFIDK